MDLANQTLPQESFEAFVFAFLKIWPANMRNQKKQLMKAKLQETKKIHLREKRRVLRNACSASRHEGIQPNDAVDDALALFHQDRQR